MTEGIAVTPGVGATLAADPCTVNGVAVLVPQNKIGVGALGSYTDVSTSNPMPVAPAAQATGGATPYKLVSAATTNATSVKGSAGTVYGIQAGNITSTPVYLKLYNKATSPTVGTDTPVKTLLIPGNTSGAGSNVAVSVGTNFSTGIALAITANMADTDTTAVGAADVVVNLDYA